MRRPPVTLAAFFLVPALGLLTVRTTSAQDAKPPDPKVSDTETYPAKPTWAEKHDEEFRFDEEGVDRLVIPPYYQEDRGGITTRFFFPIYWESFRGGKDWFHTFGIVPFYWLQTDSLGDRADVVLPFFGRWITPDSTTHLVLQTYYSKTDTGYHFGTAPLVFLGRNKDKEYQVVPPLVWRFADKESSFLLTLPVYYGSFRGDDFDWGVLPLIYAGRSRADLYTVVFPFYFRFANENMGNDLHVVPLGLSFFKERETGWSYGFMPLLYLARDVDWARTMVLPFYYGSRWGQGRSHYILPALTWFRKSPTIDQGGVVLYHWAYERGDYFHTVLPLWFDWGNTDTRESNYLLFPLTYYEHSPVGWGFVVPPMLYFREEYKSLKHGFLPLYYHAEHLYENHFDWLVLNTQYGERPDSWHFNFYPLVFLDESPKTQHYVVAPLFWKFDDWDSKNTVFFPFWWQFDYYQRLYTATVFVPFLWDFDNDRKSQRSTVVFPFWWDFKYDREGERDSIVFPFYWSFKDPSQHFTLVLNTAYHSGVNKDGGEWWKFHFFPLIEFGEPVPGGAEFNFLYGFFGYRRQGSSEQLRLLWIPIGL